MLLIPTFIILISSIYFSTNLQKFTEHSATTIMFIAW